MARTLESISTVEFTEKIDEETFNYYSRLSLYDESDGMKIINKAFFKNITDKAIAFNIKEEYVVIVGSGFLRTFIKIWGSPFKKVTGVDFIHLGSLLKISPVFKSFNANSLFIVPKKEVNNLENIWKKGEKNENNYN